MIDLLIQLKITEAFLSNEIEEFLKQLEVKEKAKLG